MSKMRAKVRVESVERMEHAERLKFSAVYGGSTNAEDNSFSSATPTATFDMYITNKALHGTFNPGQKFYVDFTPVDETPKTN